MAEGDATAKEEVKVDAPPKHRAVVIGSFGGSKHLRIEEFEEKPLGKNEVQVEVEACGLNFLDVMLRQGLIEHPTAKPPFVMGSECAGTICKVGEEVSKYKVGDKVVVLSEFGACSAKVTVPVAAAEGDPVTAVLLPWPEKLDATKAAVMAFAYLPAYILLHHVAPVRSGDVVLVHSAGGGVGTAIGQLAKSIPNVHLIGTASKVKHDRVKDLYEVLLTPDQDCVAEVKKLHPQGIDVILDCLSGEEIAKSSALLKPLGKYIIYGMSNMVTGDRKNFLSLAKHWLHVERMNPIKLVEENRVFGGFSLKSMLFSAHRRTQLIQDVWAELIKLIDSKQIDPWVDSEWSFEEIKEATMRLQERKNIGKVVLLPKRKPKGKEEADTEAAAPS